MMNSSAIQTAEGNPSENPPKKERIFYLDFIRAIAVVAILLTHYNALFLYMNPQPLQNVVITYRVCNLYIGDFGVSLFLIISGAALMYVYDKKCKPGVFYKKRIQSIYPMFWITYAIFFVMSVAVFHFSYAEVSPWKLLLTLFGFDSYFATITSTFYIVGEWFLGFIIILYAVFPLLRKGVQKCPWIFGAVIVVLYVLAVRYQSYFPMPLSLNPFVRFPEFCFGMYYIKYMRKNRWGLALFALGVLIANSILSPGFNSSIQTTYVGIAAFILLTFLARFTDCKFSRKICSFLAKYSYAIFLCHHYIIYRVAERVDWTSVTWAKSYGIFAFCVVIILLVSVGLYRLDHICKVGYGSTPQKSV